MSDSASDAADRSGGGAEDGGEPASCDGADSLASLAVDAVRQSTTPLTEFITRRVGDLLDTASYVRELAVESGVVDDAWLSHPLERRPVFTPGMEMLRRFVERLVERHPSVLGAIGLRAIELLAWDVFWERREGLHAPQEVTSHAVVVFTDLEGFTQFTTDVGDERARDVLADHLRACMPIIRRCGGRVVKRLGDGLMLAFNDETSAVHAAVELLDTAPDPLRLRAGTHGGDVIILADDLVGQVVNLAARVADEAQPGELLATADVMDKIDASPDFVVSPGGTRSFKGVDEPVRVSRVIAGSRNPGS